MSLPAIAALTAADRAIPGGLVACLAAAGYDDGSIRQTEADVPMVLGASRGPLIADALACRAGPAGGTTAVFCYGLAWPARDLRRELGDAATGACIASGLLADAGDGRLASAWRIVPFRGTFIASDRPDAGRDAVMGPGATTDALADAALPAGGSVLDVGCGAGSLALAALRAGAASALAVDINPRAVEVAAVNAALNRLDLACACGDLTAPAAGRRFDLVVSQPPYIIDAGATETVTYLHSGPRGDELAMRLLAEAPAVLADRGLAVVHFDGPADDGSLARRIAAAAGGTADVLVLAAPGLSPAVQAMSFCGLLAGASGEGYERSVSAYLAHCRSHGITSHGRFTVVLRRSSRSWSATLPCSGNRHPARPDIERALAAVDLSTAADDVLLRNRIAPPPCATVKLNRPFGAPEASRIQVTYAPQAWPPDHEVDEHTGSLCDMLAQSTDLAGAIALYADACGLDPADARAQLVAFARDGLRRGVLVAG